MPSGAKKRKAAKKKKEIHPGNNPNPSLAPIQGSGDVKQPDERQSDFGEASSTASQDPSHHDLLTEGEEEKIENSENISDLPTVEGVKGEGDNERGRVVEGIDEPVDREFKIADEFEIKNGRSEHDDTERKAYDGGSSESSSSRSSSSSDDESHGIKSNRAVVDTASISVKVDHSLHEEIIEPAITTTIGEASDAVVDSIPPVVSDKVSLLSESVEVNTSSLEAASLQKEATIPSVKSTETYDPKAGVSEEVDDRLSLSYNSPIVSLDNEADAEKDAGVMEPLLVPPPHPVETTSWKGCCGLFELFTASDR